MLNSLPLSLCFTTVISQKPFRRYLPDAEGGKGSAYLICLSCRVQHDARWEHDLWYRVIMLKTHTVPHHSSVLFCESSATKVVKCEKKMNSTNRSERILALFLRFSRGVPVDYIQHTFRHGKWKRMSESCHIYNKLRFVHCVRKIFRMWSSRECLNLAPLWLWLILSFSFGISYCSLNIHINWVDGKWQSSHRLFIPWNFTPSDCFALYFLHP